MSIPLSLPYKQPSPTSPSFKKTLLDEVKTWSEQKVAEWLASQSLGRFSQKFLEQKVSGPVLLDLDYETLKAMDIKTVGERVRLLVAIKALRQECYLSASLAARNNQTRGFHEGTNFDVRHNFNPTNNDLTENMSSTPIIPTVSASLSKSSKSSETTSAKSLLNRSNSFSRFLGRSDSKKSKATQQQNIGSSNIGSSTQQQSSSDVHSLAPSSPRTIQKRNSLEGGIMSMEKVKQTCVKVFGEDGQTRIVNVHTANEAKQIMGKVLHKFGIDEGSADSYCIFVGSSTHGEARTLSDAELVEICRSADRPEKERLILRKRHMYPTHEEFKRKGTINAASRRQLEQQDNSKISPSSYGGAFNLSPPPPTASSSSSSSSAFRKPFRSNTVASNNSQSSNNSSTHGSQLLQLQQQQQQQHGRRRFFGERPPSEMISSNLQSFFPNHNREVLETAGIKAQRLSMTRRNSALGKMEPRNYRNSVLPELVSVLGVDLDKFLEEEEHQQQQLNSTNDNVTAPTATTYTPTTTNNTTDVETSGSNYTMDDTQYHTQSERQTSHGMDDNGAEIKKEYKEQQQTQQQQQTQTQTQQQSKQPDANVGIQRRTSSRRYRKEPKPLKLEDSNKKAFLQQGTNDNSTNNTNNIPIIREPVTTPGSATSTKTRQLPDTWMKGSLIGRGTFGDVYLGLNPISGEFMAVKQVELPVENSASEERKRSMVEALRREIELLKDLEHENIVQYLGSQTDDAYFSIFLEYVPGGSVAGLLASYGAFQEPLVKSFVRQILKGLSYLHNKDIVHRDIKGANVLVDNKGGVKISDFGISKKVEEGIMMPGQSGSASAAHRPSLQGSIYWMAPEVVKQTHYTKKADIWSLGCMVVEMFTGDHPFPEFSQMQAIFQIGCYTAPNIPPNISEDAQDFLKCTFQLNFEERPSARELLEHPFIVELENEGYED